MGNDGGTIARRQDILSLHSKGRAASSNNKESNDTDISVLSTCAFSSLPLYSEHKSPIVGDYKGNLYLKEKIIEYIIKKKTSKSESQKEDPYDHIKSLSDLVNVNLTWNLIDGNPIVECPVTKEHTTKSSVFAYLRPCGCALSYRLLTELSKHLKLTEEPVKSECPKCGKDFHFDYDIVILYSSKNEKYEKNNEASYKYIQNVLDLTHSKKPRKHSSKSKSKSQSKSKTKNMKRKASEVGTTKRIKT